MLVDVATRVLLLGVIDELVHVALHRPIATGGVGIQSAPRLHGEVRRLLHRLHGAILHGMEHDGTLSADPGANRGSVFVVMPPARLAFLASTPRSTS